MKKLLVCVLSVFLLVGCGQLLNNTFDESVNMPDIVFMNTVDYNDNSNGHALTFYDKSGNYYTSDDEYVCTLSYKELINEYKAGSLNDKITFHTSCDVSGLYDNYKKLCNAVQSGDCSIVYPEIMPCVEDSIYRWYGIYYDKNGEPEITVIHKRECMTELESDNETVNEVYNWYIQTFSEDK